MGETKVLRDNRLANIIVNVSNCIDSRLIRHGERVAFILYKMLMSEGRYTEDEIRDWCIIALLHDIGAYKTEEIDQMIQFENKGIWEHSTYGYLFIREFSPLRAYADAVLYHHVEYEELTKSECRNKELAGLIHMIDKVDAGIGYGIKSIEEWLGRIRAEEKFDPQHIKWLLEVDNKEDFISQIKSGVYQEEWQQVEARWTFTIEEIEAFLKMLIFFIDFRSEDTVTHTVMTTNIAICIGRLLDYNQQELVKLEWGAAFHDLGKIGTPLEILEKPGRLTEDERKVMENHVVLTEKILRGCVEQEIIQIATRHHETLDGAGYPYGLVGDELSTSERIVGVADVMSALSMKRSYKEAFGKERIIEILTELRDRQKLCPRIVDVVLSHYDYIMEQVNVECEYVLEQYKGLKHQFYDMIN